MTEERQDAKALIHSPSPVSVYPGFRGRPYTKAVPNSAALPGTAGGSITLWTPGQAYFELALILAKSTAAGDFTICDSTAANVIGFIQFDGINYSRLDLGQAGLRAVSPINCKLLLVDPIGVVATIKSVCYGWEVTHEGNYR